MNLEYHRNFQFCISHNTQMYEILSWAEISWSQASTWPDRAKKKEIFNRWRGCATENVASEESMIHRWIEEVEKIIGSR